MLEKKEVNKMSHETILNTILVIAVVNMLVGILLLIRNECVFKFRINLLDTDRDTFYKLPPYELMVLKFWVIDFNKFIGDK